MVDPAWLRQTFQSHYGKLPRVFSAPGRVNLIGDHTDYNDGFVLPLAVDRRTYVAAALRNDRTINVRSLAVNEQAAFSLDDAPRFVAGTWSTYIEGIARELEFTGIALSGADIMIASEVPLGAGLSSSAAIEISTGFALLEINQQKIPGRELALAAQRAEHGYVGTKCGIMDQLAVTFGRKNRALFIDCRSHEIKHIPINLRNTSMVVCNTNVKHDLATSAYNKRRLECGEAVRILQQKSTAITALRDVTMANLMEHSNALPELLFRRARHVITENDRTRRASVALNAGKVSELSQLMLRSHESLRDDYQVSSPELDLLVELACQFSSTVGARMTGGGFGGCTINLVKTDELDSFSQFIASEYSARTNKVATIYSVSADDGVSETDS